MISPSDEAYSQISFLTPTFLEQPETPIPYQVSWTSHHTKLTYTMEIKFHFFITANIILFKVIITTKLFNQNLQTIFITTAFFTKKEQMLEMQIFYEIPSRTAVSGWWFFFVADSLRPALRVVCAQAVSMTHWRCAELFPLLTWVFFLQATKLLMSCSDILVTNTKLKLKWLALVN